VIAWVAVDILKFGAFSVATSSEANNRHSRGEVDFTCDESHPLRLSNQAHVGPQAII
jgi:hypothetical protein